MGHVIIFSSPAIDVPDQRQHSFVSYYMPVWGDDEFEKLLESLPTCQRKTEMQKNLMRKAHQQLGGTVGNVFVQDLQKQVDEILQVRPTQLANLCQTMTGLSENKLVEQGKYKPGWYRYITNGEQKEESEPQQDLKTKYTLASLDYISTEFKEIVEYAVEKRTTLESHQLLGAIKEAYGGFGGQIYEEEIRNSMTPSQFPTSRNLKTVQIYPQYKDKNWHQGGIQLEHLHVAEVRDVDSKTGIFSLRPHVLHVMQPKCPAIDFYFIKKEESTPPDDKFEFATDDDCEELVPKHGKKDAVTCHEHPLPVNDRVRYTLYLIQSTVGQKHSMLWHELQNHMFKIDAQITVNKNNRTTIAESEALRFKTSPLTKAETKKMKQAAELVRNNIWLQKDDGEELDSYLTGKNVRVVLLIIQKTCQPDFYLTHARPKPPKPTTRSDPHLKDQLLRKVHVTYGTFHPARPFIDDV